jgi:hypothetical protein
MRLLASLLLSVFFYTNKSWLLVLTVAITQLNIASLVKMYIKMYLKVHRSIKNLFENFIFIYHWITLLRLNFLSEPYPPPLPGILSLPALPNLWVWEGLPPVRELLLLCGLTKREQSYWGRPPMTHNFGMLCRKINYKLNKP